MAEAGAVLPHAPYIMRAPLVGFHHRSCDLGAPPTPAALHLPACRNGLRGRPQTRKLFIGLYWAMACLYIRNIFRFAEFVQVSRQPRGVRWLP